MTSYSLRRRAARRRGTTTRSVTTRSAPGYSGTVQVTVSVTDFATRVSQSFLIMPGYTATALLTGYIETNGLPRVFKVPVRIQARLS